MSVFRSLQEGVGKKRFSDGSGGQAGSRSEGTAGDQSTQIMTLSRAVSRSFHPGWKEGK